VAAVPAGRPWSRSPGCAVVLTAGLAAAHDMLGDYGIDIQDLDPGHSLHAEPGGDVWITVTIPCPCYCRDQHR